MVSEKTLNRDWINSVSKKNRNADKILVEKVIRALLLIEGLAECGLNFIFKGGTALMLSTTWMTWKRPDHCWKRVMN